MKCEELNKVSIDLQGERSRMQHENMEAVRKLNDYQKSIEMAGLDKNKVASQLKDLQTMIDDMTRQKNQAESRVQSAEQRFKTVSIEVGWTDRHCRNHRSIECPIPSCVEIFRLSFREFRASRKPAPAVGSCRTGPPAGRKIPHFSRKISMNGWETLYA